MPPHSDTGCPGETTILSGRGVNRVPYFVNRGDHDLDAAQAAALVREFNTRAELLAMGHCLRGGCLFEYVPATQAHIRYAKRDWLGWTDVYLMEVVRKMHAATGGSGGPKVFPHHHGRGAYIDPPSPNVLCRKPPPPRPIRPPAGHVGPPDPPAPIPEGHGPAEPPTPPREVRRCDPDVTMGPGPTGSITVGGFPVSTTGSVDAEFTATSNLGHAIGSVTIKSVRFWIDGGWDPNTLLFKSLNGLGGVPGLPGATVTQGTPASPGVAANPAGLTGTWQSTQYISRASEIYIEVVYVCPVCGAPYSHWFKITMP